MKRDFFDNSGFEPEPEHFVGFNCLVNECAPQKYIPEIWPIKKDLVYKLIPCLEAGLENTQTALAEHDATFGRTTAKNKMWAEALEREIRDMRDCIEELKLLNAGNSTHYP
jgi:hypothetical protein